ncbi:MAG: hypothetical protein V4702_06010 [Patescibacteria group bacterium]
MSASHEQPPIPDIHVAPTEWTQTASGFVVPAGSVAPTGTEAASLTPPITPPEPEAPYIPPYERPGYRREVVPRPDIRFKRTPPPDRPLYPPPFVPSVSNASRNPFRDPENRQPLNVHAKKLGLAALTLVGLRWGLDTSLFDSARDHIGNPKAAEVTEFAVISSALAMTGLHSYHNNLRVHQTTRKLAKAEKKADQKAADNTYLLNSLRRMSLVRYPHEDLVDTDGNPKPKEEQDQVKREWDARPTVRPGDSVTLAHRMKTAYAIRMRNKAEKMERHGIPKGKFGAQPVVVRVDNNGRQFTESNLGTPEWLEWLETQPLTTKERKAAIESAHNVKHHNHEANELRHKAVKRTLEVDEKILAFRNWRVKRIKKHLSTVKGKREKIRTGDDWQHTTYVASRKRAKSAAKATAGVSTRAARNVGRGVKSSVSRAHSASKAGIARSKAWVSNRRNP